MAIRIGIFGVILGSILLVTMLSPVWQTQTVNVTQQCENILRHAETNAAATCDAPSPQVTWGTWAIGESRSTQFHFLDLVELLFSASKAAKVNDANASNDFSSSL